MSLVSRIFPRCWIVAPILACSFLIWINSRRTERVRYVSGLAGQPPVVEATASASLHTGNTSVLPALIVPERNEVSFNWLAQTQQMLVQKQCRLRHVDYDNAPFGRDTQSASPYRWCLGFGAWLD